MNRAGRIARHTEPKRKTRLKSSRKPIPPRKADPSKRRFAKRRCRPFLGWLKTEPCCVTGKRTGEMGYHISPGGSEWGVIVHVDPAHVKPRSLGGDDLWNALPLARHLHNEQEGHTKTFEKKYGVNLLAIAAEYTARFLALHPEFAGPAGGPHD